MSSTQIKKSKRWLSMIQNIQMKDANGRIFNPPSFSHIYKMTSVKEENDQGKWYGFEIHNGKPVTDGVLYAAAKALHLQVSSGLVSAGAPPEVEPASGDNDKF